MPVTDLADAPSHRFPTFLPDGRHFLFLALREDREVSATEMSGMIGSIAHLAYHLGAIRQIDKGSRGPKEGTFQ